MQTNTIEQTVNENETLTPDSNETADTENTAAEADNDTAATAADEKAELCAALIEARVKLSLLLCGADKENLDEAAKLSMSMVAAGKEPEDAAQSIVAAYPHLKLAKREIPVFAAESNGTSDGFSAIRSIFAKR